jgi:hypothetical protein
MDVERGGRADEATSKQPRLYRVCHFGTGSAAGGGGTNAQAPNPKPATTLLWLSGQLTILPGGSGGGWVQSLLPCPGSWSSSPPSPGSLSYLAVAEEDGSRAYCHAQVVGVHHPLL